MFLKILYFSHFNQFSLKVTNRIVMMDNYQFNMSQYTKSQSNLNTPKNMYRNPTHLSNISDSHHMSKYKSLSKLDFNETNTMPYSNYTQSYCPPSNHKTQSFMSDPFPKNLRDSVISNKNNKRVINNLQRKISNLKKEIHNMRKVKVGWSKSNCNTQNMENNELPKLYTVIEQLKFENSQLNS